MKRLNSVSVYERSLYKRRWLEVEKRAGHNNGLWLFSALRSNTGNEKFIWGVLNLLFFHSKPQGKPVTASGCSNINSSVLEKAWSVQPIGLLLLHALYYEWTYAVRQGNLFPWNRLIPIYCLQSARNVLQEGTGTIYQYEKLKNSQLADIQALKWFGLCN